MLTKTEQNCKNLKLKFKKKKEKKMVWRYGEQVSSDKVWPLYMQRSPKT